MLYKLSIILRINSSVHFIIAVLLVLYCFKYRVSSIQNCNGINELNLLRVGGKLYCYFWFICNWFEILIENFIIYDIINISFYWVENKRLNPLGYLMQNVTVLASSCSSSTQSLTSKYNTLLHSFFCALLYWNIHPSPRILHSILWDIFVCVILYEKRLRHSFHKL